MLNGIRKRRSIGRDDLVIDVICALRIGKAGNGVAKADKLPFAIYHVGKDMPYRF